MYLYYQELILKFWETTEIYAPRILGAVLIFLFGWCLSKWLGRKFARFLEKTRIGQILKRGGVEKFFLMLSKDLNAAKFLGELLRWCLFILFLTACSEILNWYQLTYLLVSVIGYLPNVLVSILIFIVAAFVVDYSQKIIVGSAIARELSYSIILGKGFSLIIWILTVLAILYQLKIVPTLISIIFAGIVGLVVLILGLSLGLAGKDLAARVLKELGRKIK